MIFSLNAGFLGGRPSASLYLFHVCSLVELWRLLTINWNDPRVPFKGFGGASRLAVAKPGAKGAEKHIFLIDFSRGDGPHDGCPAQAQAACRAIFLLYFLVCLFFSVSPLGYYTIPLTGKAPFFEFNYPDSRESQEVQAPRISALKCPWLFPSPETLTQVQSASASNADRASTAGSGTSVAIQG